VNEEKRVSCAVFLYATQNTITVSLSVVRRLQQERFVAAPE